MRVCAARSPNPMRTTAGAATRMDVAYLTFGAQLTHADKLANSLRAIHNVEAWSDGGIHYHIIVATMRQPPREACEAICSLSPSRHGDMSDRIHLHTLANLSREAMQLKGRLAKLARGPGKMYLWKNMIHYILPEQLDRVLLLDSDIFIVAEVAQLWSMFDRFGPNQMIGMGLEQNQFYSSLFGSTSGALGLNSGVVLYDLRRLRASELYKRQLEGFASQRLPVGIPIKPERTRLGYIADQTLFSFMSHPTAAGAAELFFVLPCGWNRQLSPQYWTTPGFLATHQCSGPCHLLHANFKPYKRLLEGWIQSDPTGRTCGVRAAVEGARNCTSRFPKHPPREHECPDAIWAYPAGVYMMREVARCCSPFAIDPTLVTPRRNSLWPRHAVQA